MASDLSEMENTNDKKSKSRHVNNVIKHKKIKLQFDKHKNNLYKGKKSHAIEIPKYPSSNSSNSSLSEIGKDCILFSII